MYQVVSDDIEQVVFQGSFRECALWMGEHDEDYLDHSILDADGFLAFSGDCDDCEEDF